MTTLEQAIGNVTDAIDAASITRGDGKPLTVQDFDPLPGKYDWPALCAVTFGGMYPTSWTIIVRVYVDTSVDVEAAEKLGRAVVPAIDQALDDSVAVEHTAWAKTWSAELNAYVFDCAFPYPRDDF